MLLFLAQYSFLLKNPEKLDDYESLDDLTVEQLEEIVSEQTILQKVINNMPQITIKSKWIKKYLRLKKSFNKAYKNVWTKVQPECKQERPSFYFLFLISLDFC